MSKKTDYYAMIHEPVLTERMILTVKNALNNGRFIDMNVWPCRPITREQTEKGLLWLHKNKGRKVCAELTAEDRSCFGLDFDRFTFDGFYRKCGSPFGRAWFEPIYTVHARNGHWFSYSYVNGEVIIHGRG